MLEHSLAKSVDYVLYQTGSTYNVVNNYGYLSYSGSNYATVKNSTTGSLTGVVSDLVTKSLEGYQAGALQVSLAFTGSYRTVGITGSSNVTSNVSGSTATFIVYSGSGLYWAISGSTGVTFKSGSDAYDVLQPCLNYLTDNYGGKVFVRSGLPYVLGVGLVVSGSGITIEGESNGYGGLTGTRLSLPATVTNTDVIKFTTTEGVYPNHKFFGAVRNLEIIGSGSGVNGINIEKNFSDLWLDHIFVWGCGASGFKIQATGSGQLSKCWNIWFNECLSEDNGLYGWHLTGTADWTNSFLDRITIRGGHTAGNTNGIRVDSDYISNILIDGLSMDQEDQHSMYFSSGRRVIITNCRIFDGGTASTGSYAAVYVSGSHASVFPNSFQISNNIIGNHLHPGYMKNAVWLTGNYTHFRITENNLQTDTGVQPLVYQQTTGSDITIKNNNGFVTENWGTGTIAPSGTETTVTHGLDFTPSESDIKLALRSGTGNATNIATSTYTSTTFKAVVDQAPGINIYFIWWV